MNLASNINLLAEACIFVDSTIETPSATRLIIRKDTGSDVLFIDTDIGQQEIMTGDGPVEFTTVLVKGDDDQLVTIGTNSTILIDSNAPNVSFGNDVNLTGNFFVTGQLANDTVDFFSTQDPLIKLSAGQTASDVYTQGIYSTYVDAGTRYRGICYHPADQCFTVFNDMITSPTTSDPLSPLGDIGTLSMSVASALQCGTGLLVNIEAEEATTPQTYTVPAINATFALANTPQTFSGKKTFSQLSVNRPIGGILYDNQMISFQAYLNPTNTNQAIGPQPIAMRVASTSSGSLVALIPYIQFGNGTAGVIEFGSIQIKLQQGSYVLCFTYVTAPNRSICEMYCAALGVSTVFDGYVASISSGGGSQRISFNVAVAGVYNFSLRQTGKNASSSSYIMTFAPIMFLSQFA